MINKLIENLKGEVVGRVREEVEGVLLLKENNTLIVIELITWWMDATLSMNILLGTKSKIFVETIMIREVNRFAISAHKFLPVLTKTFQNLLAIRI